MRAIFFDEDDAAAVVARLLRDGFEAHVERERLAGEDDDEDHPWAVLSDAPELLLEVLVDEYDGWLDHDDETPGPDAPSPPLNLPPLKLPPSRGPAAAPAPPPLPSAPRRVKRPDLLGD